MVADAFALLGLPRKAALDGEVVKAAFQIAAAAAHPGGDELTFLDVRSPEEYRGERLHPEDLPGEVSQVAGHIPGARNVPWDASTNRDGTFRRVGELRELYGEAGLTPDRDIVTYCSVGERSAHSWFVLHELLGYPNVKNYDGSWTEWGSVVNTPIEKGAAQAARV